MTAREFGASHDHAPHLDDFEIDAATGVYLPPRAGTRAGYLDGAERRLRDGLPGIGDRGTGSEELAGLIEDWPTEYHLTPYRSTIFEALGLTRARMARVLELGCGCGAVTRWLGEHCGEVHAIEGDLARAHVAALRCEDLSNVRVYSANYSELRGLESFDVATLVGVLEYGHLYHPDHRHEPDAAAAANLRLARRALSDDGLLVVAIENRLGLKYLNGAREDHSGRLFEGIQGYPDRSTPVTWSARTLERLLRGAGFADVDFLLPFPDYKLARTILNPAAATDAHALHNWVDAPAPDRGAQRAPTLYNESLATRELARAGILPELANSFLVLAWAGDRESAIERLGVDLEWSARHYSLDRKPGVRKSVTLRRDEVIHAPALSGDAGEADRQALTAIGLHHALGAEAHRPGDSLLLDVFESLAGEGIGPAFQAHLADFRAWLLESFPAPGGALEAVDGRAFDATWWNLIVHPDTGEWQVIDEEWRLAGPIPVDFLVWRMTHHFALRYANELPAEIREVTAQAFADLCARSVSPALDEALLAAFADVDAGIQLAIAPGGPVERPDALDLLQALAAAPTYTLVGLVNELADRPALLSTYREVAEQDGTLKLIAYAPGQGPEDAATALRSAMDEATVDESAFDIVLLAVDDTAEAERSIAAEADAVLSDAVTLLPSVAVLPHFGSGDSAALRSAIEVATGGSRTVAGAQRPASV